jgi:hypothetical protein
VCSSGQSFIGLWERFHLVFTASKTKEANIARRGSTLVPNQGSHRGEKTCYEQSRWELASHLYS